MRLTGDSSSMRKSIPGHDSGSEQTGSPSLACLEGSPASWSSLASELSETLALVPAPAPLAGLESSAALMRAGDLPCDPVFVDAAELQSGRQDRGSVPVIYGVGEYARQVWLTLTAHGIPVYGFYDPTGRFFGEVVAGVRTVGRRELSSLPGPLVVVGESGYGSIGRDLRGCGIGTFHVLRECLKYPYEEHLADRRELAEYFDNYEERVSPNILLELYGYLGDLLVKAGLIRFLVERHGRDRVHVVCNDIFGGAAAELAGLLADRVVAVNPRRFAADRPYRLGLLSRLNSLYCRESICLSNVTHVCRRRVLNEFNLNVRRVWRKSALHFRDYMPENDFRFMRRIIPDLPREALSPRGCLEEGLKKVAPPLRLPPRPAAVCLGASSRLRCYPAEKFVEVGDYLADRGFQLLLLGFGAAEDDSYDRLLGGMRNPAQALNLSSRLSLPESLWAIKNSLFFVGVESGLWNAAYALDKPSAVIYGGGDYYGFRHPDPGIEYVSAADGDCFGCRWECRRAAGTGSAPCLENIQPGEIIAALEKILLRLG